ncbi:MAG: LysR family transcriptional regulator [Pseudomonadota bacterium]
MQTRLLKTLTEIAEAKSFVAAAARLNMTLSAVSMQMKTLEADLGVALFDRSSRPPRLTPMGRTVCTHAASVIAAEAALRAAASADGTLKGAFRIGIVPTASVRLLPAFLLAVRRHAPEARFQTITALTLDLEARVRAKTLDAAVVTGTDAPFTGLSDRTLGEEPLAFAAPTSAAGSPQLLAHTLPFLQFAPASGIGTLIARYRQRLPKASDDIVLDSADAIMECVNAGVGFTLLPTPDILRLAAPTTRIIEADPPLARRLALIAPADAPAAQVEALSALFMG